MAQNTNSLDLELGSSQYASRADTASLSIVGDLTLECWVKPESGGSLQNLIAKWDATGNLRSFRLMRVSATNLQFQASADGISGATASSNTNVGNSSWVHVAVTYNAAAGTCAFYLNGVADGTGSGLNTSIHDNASRFAIGTSDAGGTPTEFYDGLIDEVRVWNTIRTAAQILANFRVELAGSESGLVAYYRLNNAYTDLTANANDLTAAGSPVFSADVPFAGTGGSGLQSKFW